MAKRKKRFDFFVFLKKHFHIILIALLCLFVLTSHILYVNATRQYPRWDENTYLDMAMDFLDTMQNRSQMSIGEVMAKDNYSGRQPLYSLVIAAALFIVGTANAYKTALIINGLLYITTIVAVYFLAKEFMSKTASVMASLLFACYGFPLFYLHFTYTETASTTFATLSLLFLKKTDNFSNYRFAFLTGLFFTLSNMIRWVAPIFFAGPFLYTIITTVIAYWRSKKRNIKKPLLGLGIFLTVGVALPLLIYYIPHINSFLIYVTSSTANSPRWVSQFLSPDLVNPFSTRSVMFYFNIFSQQTIFLFILFVIGFLFSLIKFKKYGFLLAAFIVPYCFFTFITVLKDDRFIVPVYPIMAIISAVVFAEVKNMYAKGMLIVLITIIALISFFAGSWGIGPMGFQGLKDIVLPSFIHHPRRIYLTPMVWPPRKEESNIHLVYEYIEKDWKNPLTKPVTLGAFSYEPVDHGGYAIIKYEKRDLVTPTTLVSVSRDEYKELFRLVKDADYIFTKDKEPIQEIVLNLEQWYMIGQFVKAMQLQGGQLPDAFEKTMVIDVPIDTSHISIYKKTRPITKDELLQFADLFAQLDPEKREKIITAAEDVAKKLPPQN